MSCRTELHSALCSHTQRGNITLNRQEATERLHKLEPGTLEHTKLQDALTRIEGIAEISLPDIEYKVYTASEEHKLLGGFGSAEHVAIGRAVKLKGIDKPLLVKGITEIQFQHIVALAGDFYAVAGEAISLPGGSDQEKTARFQKAFNTLANAENSEIRKVLQEIDGECLAVEHSSLPHHCYSNQMLEKNRAIKQIKNDIEELLIDNSDHFANDAREAYRIGHTLALSLAKTAGEQKNIEGLKHAYAIDAFACHFLTDLFAAGHIRNQRGALEIFLIDNLGFSKEKAKPLAGVLTGAQHEKDGNQGLNVMNQKGEQWRAYGDGCYFNAKSEENRQKVIEATQQSVDEVYAAFATTHQSGNVYDLIPTPTAVNPLPLYSVQNNLLIIYQDGKEIKITSKLQYLNTGLSQAVRYLPESYISGFLTPFQIDMPILTKVIVPQVERLTGIIWHMVGLATYNQVKKEHQGINEKIDEMADGVLATYETNVKILEKLHAIDSSLSEHILFQEIRDPITNIKGIAHQLKLFKVNLNDSQIVEAEKAMWQAYIKISTVFNHGTAEGKKILIAYRDWLAKSEKMGPVETKIAVTRWFRHMLDYQIKAFNLHAALQILKNRNATDEVKQKIVSSIQNQVPGFEKDLEAQIEANKEHIDETLVYESDNYIALKLQKSTTKRLAALEFKK